MKVIHLISGGDSGGAKTHVLSLLQNLNKSITAQLVCFRDGPFADEARQLHIPTKIMDGNHILRIRNELTRYILDGGYQVIHCHGARANMIGILLRSTTGLPVVSTVHSDYKLDYMGRPLGHLIFGTINAFALRKMDYRIGVSDAMVDLLISRGFPPDRFYALYNGIDFTPAPPQGDRTAYLQNLGVDLQPDSVVIGIVARLNPVKDIATLIRGFAAGVTLADGQKLAPASVQPLSEDGLLVRVELRQGVYHQIKRMFGVYGAGVNTLHRDGIGGVVLDQALAPGQYRPLTEAEVDRIRLASQEKMS